jgi:hypothetical protein
MGIGFLPPLESFCLGSYIEVCSLENRNHSWVYSFQCRAFGTSENLPQGNETGYIKPMQTISAKTNRY